VGVDAPDPVGVRWRWSQPVPLRWLLVDEYTMGQPDTAVAVCADLGGVFVDPPAPPPAERYTLLGCAPTGRLAAACTGAGPAWLGNAVLDAVHHADRPRTPGCDPVDVGCCACMEELLDLTVVEHGPSVGEAGLLDVTLEGRLRLNGDRYTCRTTADAPDVAGYVLTGDGEDLGRCRDVAGVFRPRPEPALPPVTLLGCRPEPPLSRALAALARGAGNHGGAVWRRRVDATVFSVAADGSVARFTGGPVHGSVAAVRPSNLGHGLVDVVFDSPAVDTVHPAARAIWELWRSGGPAEPGGWVGLDRDLRAEWAMAAPYREHSWPASAEFHLDGRHVTDIEGFYCAIGEAVNGPGGYFGATIDGVLDCVDGPFRLVWHDSAVARAHLVPGYDRRRWAPAITLDEVVGWLAEAGVEVDPR
jgi:hypothetical protein